MDETYCETDAHSLIGDNIPAENTDAESRVKTVLPTHTFLEKMFLLAEEFQKERPRSVRMSRHLYDLEKLMDTQYGRDALTNRTLYDDIVEHRKTYYALKYVNYALLSPSTINFMIPEQHREEWQADYANMRRFFIFASFSYSLKRCKNI